MFAATHRFKPNDPLIGAMRRLAKHPKLSPKGVMQINYALAKAMEDTRQTDKVFPYLRKANNSQAALWPEDANERKEEWQAVVAAQDGLAPIETKEATSPNLIFVTGLPRSGTTLAEQIVGSHSQVQAGGEIATAFRTAYTAFVSGTDMQKLGVLPQDQLRDFAKKLEMQNKRYANAAKPCLTDKSIMAFLIYGLLHAALPNARFVVVHRDPRDIAVSIYKNYFTGGTHRYANDLISIADTIKSFRAIIAHWREVLPDRFTEVRYEDLVADPTSRSKALIAAAGLPWEDQCLRFHENTGTVKTLSLHQVRQPVYHRHRRIFSLIQQSLFFERPDHDQIHVAAQDARCIGNGFAVAKLHFRTRQQHGLTAHLAHAHVKADARTGRGFFEDERHHAPLKRKVVIGRATRAARACRFHALRAIKDVPQSGLIGFVNIKKMGHRFGLFWPRKLGAPKLRRTEKNEALGRL